MVEVANFHQPKKRGKKLPKPKFNLLTINIIFKEINNHLILIFISDYLYNE